MGYIGPCNNGKMKAIHYAIAHPKKVLWMMIAAMLVSAAFVPMIKIDTDPENMLAHTEPVRVKHDELKTKFNMHDMVVVGIINDENPNGVFNKQSLTDIYELSRFAYEQRYQDADDGSYRGVVQRDVMTLTNMDYMEPKGTGQLEFDWLMKSPPANEAEALAIKQRLLNNELFYNTIISEDGKALAMYLPITAKDESHTLATKLSEKIAEFDGDDQYHITGLPVAEDTFGIEMFIQMAFSAPAAMVLIFVLMMLFFKKLRLVLSPLIVAMVSVIITMGLLIGTGHTVHIMSSMIPIFIMPIAVLDSVHILSEFYDNYQKTGDRKATLMHVMQELYKPMLFTSLTSAAGFASLAMTPIPPVQVFGIFVGFGILLAWFLTMTFIPAYIMLTDESSLATFGTQSGSDGRLLARLLAGMQGVTYRRPAMVTAIIIALTALAAYGVTKININDNPVKWFTKSHPIRVADHELNKHFGGTYMAFLNLDAKQVQTFDKKVLADAVAAQFPAPAASPLQSVALGVINKYEAAAGTDPYEAIAESLLDIADTYTDDESYDYLERVADYVSLAGLEASQPFKNPAVLNYMLGLEDYLSKEGGVGKSSSIAKMVRSINKELHEGSAASSVIPTTVSGVGQCLLSYQNSHIPERLRHFVSSDYTSANVWLQLRSGDNQDMEATIAAVDQYMSDNPPPAGITKDWFGLTYINVVWQKKMVAGMMEAFLGSFVIVFLMMAFLFRSVIWALLCMIPLSLTILIIYGVIGWIGKDYDMPVAVLSSLALGLAVDFAIHFLVRARASLRSTGSWQETSQVMFGEPSRAIVRNLVVIAVGFLPLLLATLIPYRTVGVILAAILVLSGVVTLLLLPSLISLLRLKK